MIKPVNGHLLIEPVPHETFVASERGTFEEIGIVLDAEESNPHVKKGDRVFFDSWMCAKYPKNDEEFYWLVPWSEIRAVEHAEVPE